VNSDDETIGGTEPFVVSIDLKPGTLFHGRYEILGPLGRGGMGMVYKARDRRLDEVVAIKVLRPDFGNDPTMAERFRSEIKLARKVRHRNVCAIHDYGEDRGLLYISMEYIEGVDLKQVLKQSGALPAHRGYEVAIQITEGLQAVHDAGIIHRDLKTPNIMSDGAGIARLMDFGVAKRVGEGAATVTGQIIGTPEYMSPEQAQGHKLDTRSDIYALGIVLYEIFTGQVPFRGETPISTILKHLNDPPPLEGPQASGIPGSLKPVLRRCLAKDPADRYATAREVGDALREARHPSRRQQPIATEVLLAPTMPRAIPPPRRRAISPWLLAIPLVAVGASALLLRNLGAPTPVPLDVAPPPTTIAATVPMTSAATLPPATVPAVPVDAGPEISMTPAAPTPTVRSSQAGPTRPSVRPSRAPVAIPAPSTLAAAPPPTLAAAPPSTAAAAPAGPGLLQVVVKPWGEVQVDGRSVGTTPLDRLSLPSGTHAVTVRHPLYEPWEGRVTIRAGQTERVMVDFPAQGRRKQ
jgi:serine/threonine protein kinase